MEPISDTVHEAKTPRLDILGDKGKNHFYYSANDLFYPQTNALLNIHHKRFSLQ